MGDLPEHWLPFAEQLAVYGFEPNQESCAKLNEESSRFAEAKFFPYAIGGKEETRPFHFARYDECSSLLSPNMEWLNRFSYGKWFEVTETEDTRTRTLDNLPELPLEKIDAIKIDSQGMEMPILLAAQKLLSHAFFLEIETGMQANYHDETTFDQIAPFLREKGFICMQFRTQPSQARANKGENWKGNKGQPMACESIWLKDFVSARTNHVSEEKALRCMALCAMFEFYDFGLELSDYFLHSKSIQKKVYNSLQKEDYWHIRSEPHPPKIACLLAHLSHFLPSPMRPDLANVLPQVARRPNFLKSLLSPKKN